MAITGNISRIAAAEVQLRRIVRGQYRLLTEGPVLKRVRATIGSYRAGGSDVHGAVSVAPDPVALSCRSGTDLASVDVHRSMRSTWR